MAEGGDQFHNIGLYLSQPELFDKAVADLAKFMCQVGLTDIDDRLDNLPLYIVEKDGKKEGMIGLVDLEHATLNPIYRYVSVLSLVGLFPLHVGTIIAACKTSLPGLLLPCFNWDITKFVAFLTLPKPVIEQLLRGEVNSENLTDLTLHAYRGGVIPDAVRGTLIWLWSFKNSSRTNTSIDHLKYLESKGITDSNVFSPVNNLTDEEKNIVAGDLKNFIQDKYKSKNLSVDPKEVSEFSRTYVNVFLDHLQSLLEKNEAEKKPLDNVKGNLLQMRTLDVGVVGDIENKIKKKSSKIIIDSSSLCAECLRTLKIHKHISGYKDFYVNC